jgi:hypothetical protein
MNRTSLLEIAAHAALWLAAAVGFWYGLGFGLRLGGPLLGVVTALSLGVMSALLASAVIDRLPIRRR